MAKRFNIFLVVFLIFALLFSALGSELLRRYDLTSVRENGFKAHTSDENEIRSSLSEKVKEYNRENDRIETDSLVVSEARYLTEQEAIRQAEELRRQEELRKQQETLRAIEEERERERQRHEALLREQEEARLREEERQAEIARQQAILKAQEEAAIAEEDRQAEIARMEALLQEQEQARIEEEQRQAEIARQEELVRQKEVEEQLERERHEALLQEQEEERQAEMLRAEEERRQAEEARLLREQEEAAFAEAQRLEDQRLLEEEQRLAALEQAQSSTKTEDSVIPSDTHESEASQDGSVFAETTEGSAITGESQTIQSATERVEERSDDTPVISESEILDGQTTPRQTEAVVDEVLTEAPLTPESSTSQSSTLGQDVSETQTSIDTAEQDITLPTSDKVDNDTEKTADASIGVSVEASTDVISSTPQDGTSISLSDKVAEAHLKNALNSINSASEIAPYAQDGKEMGSLTNDDMALSYSALRSSVQASYEKLTGDVKTSIDAAIRKAVDIRAEFLSLSSLMWYVTVLDNVPLIRYAFNDGAWTEVENTTKGVFAIPYTIDRDDIKLSVELFVNEEWSSPYNKVVTKNEIEKARSKSTNMLKSFENVLTNLGKDIDIVQLPSSEI